MFYCDPCARPRGWPTRTLMSSHGRCECCGATAVCNDVPSSLLPLPADVEPLPPRDTSGDRYYANDGCGEREVTMAEYMSIERAAGFHSHVPGRPATGSFGNGRLSGRIQYGAAAETNV